QRHISAHRKRGSCVCLHTCPFARIQRKYIHPPHHLPLSHIVHGVNCWNPYGVRELLEIREEPKYSKNWKLPPVRLHHLDECISSWEKPWPEWMSLSIPLFLS